MQSGNSITNKIVIPDSPSSRTVKVHSVEPVKHVESVQKYNAKNIVVGTNNGSVGDNNYYGVVQQRHLTKADYSYILRTIPLSTSKIGVYGVGQTQEAQNFRNEIYSKLRELGYKNIDLSLNTAKILITDAGASSIITNSGEFKIIEKEGTF